MTGFRSDVLLHTAPTSYDSDFMGGPSAHTGQWRLEASWSGGYRDDPAMVGVSWQVGGFRQVLRRQGWAHLKVKAGVGRRSTRRTLVVEWTDRPISDLPFAPSRPLPVPPLALPLLKHLHRRNLARWAARPLDSYGE